MLYLIGIIAVGVILALQYLLKDKAGSFLTRLLSGIVLVLLALMTIGSGGWVLFCTALLLSLIGMVELFRALGIRKEGKPDTLELLGYVGVAVYYVCIGFLPEQVRWIGILLALMVILAYYVFAFPRCEIRNVMEVVFSILYVGVMLSCVWQIRMMETGKYLVWLVFLAAWGSDTCAYCAGMLWGKHKMTPVLSPKKTIEGAVGGLAGAAVLGLLYGFFTTRRVVIYMLICLIGAAVSMIGDLAASAVKRQVGVKDFGTLIPGHGGVLDRFDSVIFTAPVIYLLAFTWIT